MSEAIWQEVECGGYRADLNLWHELAQSVANGAASARVLDIGCGVGRVSLELARSGVTVTALDSDQDLLDELQRRAALSQLEVVTVRADASEFDLNAQFDLIAAPMQLVQLLPGSAARRAFLDCCRRHLAAGGLVVVVLMELAGEELDGAYIPPVSDIRELDGWVYSSQPVAVRTLDRGRAIALDRVRTSIDPAGQSKQSKNTVRLRTLDPDRLELEARREGLHATERRIIPATEDHVGSVAVLFRRER